MESSRRAGPLDVPKDENDLNPQRCHSERSEESPYASQETLHFVQGDRSGQEGYPHDSAAVDLQAIEQEIVQRCQEAHDGNLVALALFGSFARGEETEFSDIDILLIARDLPENPFRRQRLVKEPLLGVTLRKIAVLARTVEEFTADVSPLHLDLACDAVILYDPDGFLAEKLERVRELIEEAGLERQRTPTGWVWWWKDRPPRPGWALTWEGFRP